ncbi:cytochrome c oxidase subunit 4 [Rugosimonospora africana]|uniref:Cytochrome c oxidase polypeptide 4 n=1 Tax=Rugosimonospora africana TaxID=556532 RepID=A0A8J3QMY3_9ACTN|nr:cytochrome c oxidase subunit 4 [Rugosimonospora africana]GIH14010.1 cytochrome c oxidase polypeptide 4 [Rugosimonospora africana]
MRTESTLFNIIGAFLYLCAGTYAWWTDKLNRIEWAGTMELLLAGTLAVAVGMYFAFVARRIHPRPEDRHAAIAEGAGDIGFFSPGSYWPLGLGLAVAVGAIGIAMAQSWLAILGLIGVFLTTGGLLFEYYHVKTAAGD